MSAKDYADDLSETVRYALETTRAVAYRADLGQLAAVMLIGFLSLRRTVP